jgi:HK97 family phage major capsid protein
MSDNIETLLNRQGEAFDAFKAAHAEEIKELKAKGVADPVLIERMSKIEGSLDKAIEGRNALDAAIKAEKKEREELELKLGRMNLAGHSDESAKREVEIKSFNDTLKGVNSGRNRAFQALDGKAYDAYKSAQEHYLREGKDNLTPDELKTMSVGSDPDGGYFVTPDVTGRIVKKVYETSPMRQKPASSPSRPTRWKASKTSARPAPATRAKPRRARTTTTPQVGKWRIQPYWIDTEPKATQQLLDDVRSISKAGCPTRSRQVLPLREQRVHHRRREQNPRLR